MGNLLNISCDTCCQEYGEKPIVRISHNSNLNNKTLCLYCYQKQSKSHIIKSKIICKHTKCERCNYISNPNITSRAIFQIYWYGKFGNRIMCERCVFDKPYRSKFN